MKKYLKLHPISKQFTLQISILKSMMYCGVLWGLYHDGWAIKTEPNDDNIFPFWLNSTQAYRYAQSHWPDYHPRKISSQDFEKLLLPTLTRFKVRPALFSSSNRMFKLSTLQMKHFFFNRNHMQTA